MNAVPPLEPDSPLTVGPRVEELPLLPLTDEVDEDEELELLDEDVGGGVVEVEVELGQLLRSAVASSEK